MSTATATAPDTTTNALTTGRLPRWAPWALLGFSWVVFVIVFSIIAMAGETEFNIAAALFLGTILFDVLSSRSPTSSRVRARRATAS